MLNKATPLFLLGSPRSGTTALSKFLNAHPNIIMTNETAVMLQLSELVNKSHIGSMAGILYGKQYGALWAEHLASESRALVTGYYERIAKSEGRSEMRYFGDKHPHYAHCLEFIEDQFPESRYIYLVRDARDATCSLARMSKKDFPTALDNWMRFAQKHEDFIEILEPRRITTIRYEDMLADSDATFDKLLTWLGLSVEDGMREFIYKNRNVDAHNVRRRQNFSKKSVSRWQGELDRKEQQLAARLAGPFLKKYGYPLS